MENEIRYVMGCFDCPFYSLVTEDDKAWCSVDDKYIKFYKRNTLPKDCPLRTKNITVAADI